MSVECIQYPGQLNGLSYEKAKLYGMPHIGAEYARKNDVDATRWTGMYRLCAACGKAGGAHSKHHEPPKSSGRVFLLRCRESESSPGGQFVLRPALIDLCGSGTTGCHGQRHGGKLAITWEWDSDFFERAWWNGDLLAHGYAPHDRRLYSMGRYVFERRGPDGGWATRWEHRDLLYAGTPNARQAAVERGIDELG